RGRRAGDRRLRSGRDHLQQGDDLRFQTSPPYRALWADYQPDRRDVAGITVMSGPLSYDPAALAPRDRYKMLISLVIPRPIALVTTIGPTGVVNAAPFSFFNVFSDEPPLCVLGLQSRPNGSLKDTSAHIRDRGAFVVNLVDEALGEQMNQCAVDFPAEVSEIDVAKFSLLPGDKIKIPRIAEAPAALECRHYTTLEVSAQRRL